MADVQENVDLTQRIRLTEEIISKGLKQPSPMLFMLHGLQDEIGYISEDAVHRISESLKVPLPEVLSIITFHHQFKLQMTGMPEEARNSICLCSGAPCYTKGSQPIAEELCNLLGIQIGEITKDKKFSLIMVDCLGACALAPVMVINDDIHGNLTAEKLSGILEKYE